MLVVGVTGGIGVGKTTVSEALAQLGARVIDADQMAREVVVEDSGVLQELVETFGSEILKTDGTLDRRELGRRALGDRWGRARLNEILHPRIVARIKDLLDQLRQTDYRGIVVVDAALLVECRALFWVDKLVVVEAPEGIRRQRLMKHQSLSPQEIDDRMAAQLSSEEKSKWADYRILNDQSLPVLQERVRQVWVRLLEDLSRQEG
jgi:dephospho-CoA kinase